LEGPAFLKLIAWLLPSSVAMGLVATSSLSFLPIGGVVGRLLRVSLPTLIGGIVFLALMFRSNLPEVQQVISKLRSLKSRWQKGR
jgi:hypothetical protein